METLKEKFGQFALTREQMKEVKGGDAFLGYGCQGNNGIWIVRSSQSTANSLCGGDAGSVYHSTNGYNYIL
jgi:hypothetical protein